MDYAKLNAGKLGISVALAVLLVWIVFALFGWLTGGAMMMRMGAEMGAGMDAERFATTGMFVGPLIIGGIMSAIGSGLMAWLTASIYNRLL